VLFNPRPATEFYYTPIGGLWGAHVFKAKNPPFGAYINYYLAAIPRDNVSITIENAKGQTVRELDGTNRAGLNRVVWDLRPDPREAIGDQRGADSQVPYVPAGEYTVRMKYGDFRASTKLTVEAEPGVHAGEFVAQ
jgi:flagellar hook assembly protein FlgD